eukprot:6213757-Pleurochrysis_carterae.AAC.1
MYAGVTANGNLQQLSRASAEYSRGQSICESGAYAKRQIARKLGSQDELAKTEASIGVGRGANGTVPCSARAAFFRGAAARSGEAFGAACVLRPTRVRSPPHSSAFSAPLEC